MWIDHREWNDGILECWVKKRDWNNGILEYWVKRRKSKYRKKRREWFLF
jgi:hypothetical protein